MEWFSRRTSIAGIQIPTGWSLWQGPRGPQAVGEQGLVGTLGVSGRKGVLPPESAAPGAPSSVPTARSTARLAASSLEHAPGAAMRP
jgi:hypothetical protein